MIMSELPDHSWNYLIRIAIIGTFIFPIVFIIFVNFFLRQLYVKIKIHLILSFIFISLFLCFQLNINKFERETLITINKITSSTTLILMVLLVYKFVKSKLVVK